MFYCCCCHLCYCCCWPKCESEKNCSNKVAAEEETTQFVTHLKEVEISRCIETYMFIRVKAVCAHIHIYLFVICRFTFSWAKKKHLSFALYLSVASHKCEFFCSGKNEQKKRKHRIKRFEAITSKAIDFIECPHTILVVGEYWLRTNGRERKREWKSTNEAYECAWAWYGTQSNWIYFHLNAHCPHTLFPFIAFVLHIDIYISFSSNKSVFSSCTPYSRIWIILQLMLYAIHNYTHSILCKTRRERQRNRKKKNDETKHLLQTNWNITKCAFPWPENILVCILWFNSF